MWAELFLMNKDALLCEMNSFIKEFNRFKDMIQSGDRKGLEEKMKTSTARRALFDKK